jgi:hypothetical protein
MSSSDDKLIAVMEARARPGSVRFAPPGDPQRDYLGSGSHPDMVTRLWEGINPALPADCRALVYGTPGLVQPDTQLVLAVAYGTQYIVRASERAMREGLPAGMKSTFTWSNKKTTDLAEFGPDWFFGKWLPEEIEWCSENFFRNDVENA